MNNDGLGGSANQDGGPRRETPTEGPSGISERTAVASNDQFAEFGPVEAVALSKIQRLSGQILARNWAQIPHVTHHDEADITELCTLRCAVRENERPSLVSLCVKAVVAALIEFPRFNASLAPNAGELILKKYFHIGVAIDTPNGLVVGVVRECDRKPVLRITNEVAALAAKARQKGLSYAEIMGGCFTISSLGTNGGLGFTPIINAPEVAILGLSRQVERPVRGYDGQLHWRQMLPLSLSYDHRVINGADAAKFCTRLRNLLSETSKQLLASG